MQISHNQMEMTTFDSLGSSYLSIGREIFHPWSFVRISLFRGHLPSRFVKTNPSVSLARQQKNEALQIKQAIN